MDLFSHLQETGHEQIVFCNDQYSGLKAIIAIHDTTLGPALGGTRMWDYADTESALNDVLRLSRGMTYKAAVAGLYLGGGKAVIIGDPKIKSEALFRTFGRFIESLGGRYITAEDVNTSVADMEYVATETNFVTGVSSRPGGSGDPSPVTAFGTFNGIRAAVRHRLKKDSMSGIRVAVQGAGSVGRYLCQYLTDAGAKVWICDIDEKKVQNIVKSFGATAVEANQIYGLDVDVFAPCALGAILNDETIPILKCPIVAGASNNQLKIESKHGRTLREKNILYAPDYVINAGGLINVYNEIKGYNAEIAKQQAGNIYQTLLSIFEEADRQNVSTHIASDSIAEKRIASVRKAQSIRNCLPNQKWVS